VFRNVGIKNLDAGELPRRKRTTFTTWWKIEIKPLHKLNNRSLRYHKTSKTEGVPVHNMRVCRENWNTVSPIISLLTSTTDGGKCLTSCCGHFLFHYVKFISVHFAYLIKFVVSIQGTTGYPKATMMTHHILVNNAIIAGKHLELNIEVLYMCINYVDKKPVEESDRPLTPIRS
jgi:hypothetical protein